MAKGEAAFWFWMHIIFGVVGGLIAIAFGFSFWLGCSIAILALWGIPLCGCIFD